MKDDKGRPAEPQNIDALNKDEQKNEGKPRSHPDAHPQQQQRKPKSDQKDDDPLSIGESDGSAN